MVNEGECLLSPATSSLDHPRIAHFRSQARVTLFRVSEQAITRHNQKSVNVNKARKTFYAWPIESKAVYNE
jgi:hypothetical protein